MAPGRLHGWRLPPPPLECRPAEAPRHALLRTALLALACSFAGLLQAFVHGPPRAARRWGTARIGRAAEASFADEAAGASLEFGEEVETVRISPNNRVCIVEATALLRALYNPSLLMFASMGGDIQRNLDHEHLASLKQYQTEHKRARGFYSFPNPIFVAKCKGCYAVLDGQHRLETIRILQQSESAPIPVLVSVFDLQDLDEYDDLFVALNKNKPVRLYRNLKGWKEVLKQLESYFQRTFPKYLKTSKKPAVPHINLDSLMAFMDENSMVERIGLGYEALVREIEELNFCYRYHWKELLHDRKYVTGAEKKAEKCKAKDPDNPLFLGIFADFEWLKRIELKARRHVPYMKMNHVPDAFRPKISKKLRGAVWQKRGVDGPTGYCRACSCELDQGTFECGHIVSVASLGETELSNLVPICKACNDELGMDDWDEFIRRRVQTMPN